MLQLLLGNSPQNINCIHDREKRRGRDGVLTPRVPPRKLPFDRSPPRRLMEGVLNKLHAVKMGDEGAQILLVLQ